MKTEELLFCNQQGLFPGPEESLQAFIHRVKKDLPENLSSSNRYPFDINPALIPISFENKGLMPWQGGCLWISEESGSFSAQIQIRKKLPFFYKQKELIAHESIHAARLAFEEPLFEEILAYQASPRSYRNFLGPVVRNDKESLLFVGSCLLTFLLSFPGLLFDMDRWIVLSGAATVALSLFGIGRLFYYQRKFKHALKNLTQLMGEREKALAALVRLTDKEILLFAAAQPSEILAFVKSQTSFRWDIIRHAYF